MVVRVPPIAASFAISGDATPSYAPSSKGTLGFLINCLATP